MLSQVGSGTAEIRHHRDTTVCCAAGFRYVGSWNNPLDLAPNFAGTLMGLSGLFCYLTAALVPHSTHIMASLVGQENLWTGLFLLVAADTILANTVFLDLGTAELQSWNNSGAGGRTRVT